MASVSAHILRQLRPALLSRQGTSPTGDSLLVVTPSVLRRFGSDVRTDHDVRAVDAKRKVVTVRGPDGREFGAALRQAGPGNRIVADPARSARNRWSGHPHPYHHSRRGGDPPGDRRAWPAARGGHRPRRYRPRGCRGALEAGDDVTLVDMMPRSSCPRPEWLRRTPPISLRRARASSWAMIVGFHEPLPFVARPGSGRPSRSTSRCSASASVRT